MASARAFFAEGSAGCGGGHNGLVMAGGGLGSRCRYVACTRSRTTLGGGSGLGGESRGERAGSPAAAMKATGCTNSSPSLQPSLAAALFPSRLGAALLPSRMTVIWSSKLLSPEWARCWEATGAFGARAWGISSWPSGGKCNGAAVRSLSPPPWPGCETADGEMGGKALRRTLMVLFPKPSSPPAR